MLKQSKATSAQNFPVHHAVRQAGLVAFLPVCAMRWVLINTVANETHIASLKFIIAFQIVLTLVFHCLGLSDEGKCTSYSVSWLGKAIVCEAVLSKTIKFIGSVSNLEFCRVLIFAVLHLEPRAWQFWSPSITCTCTNRLVLL